MEYNTSDKIDTTTQVNMHESQTISKHSKLKKNAFIWYHYVKHKHEKIEFFVV